jgi:hypothetical protein
VFPRIDSAGVSGRSGLSRDLPLPLSPTRAGVFRKTHVGRAVDDTEALRWAEDTMRSDDQTQLLKIRDMIKMVVDESRFRANVEKLKGLTQGTAKNPVAAVEVLSNKLGLSEGEKTGLLTSLIESKDYSMWSIVNAVTAKGQA